MDTSFTEIKAQPEKGHWYSENFNYFISIVATKMIEI